MTCIWLSLLSRQVTIDMNFWAIEIHAALQLAELYVDAWVLTFRRSLKNKLAISSFDYSH